jgi:hypothetical protein
MTTTIRLSDHTGPFAEDKDVAREIRVKHLEPALAAARTVTVDFSKVPLATQSFLHAMLSATIRNEGAAILDRIVFKACSPAVRNLVKLVCEYSQETDELRKGEATSDKRMQRTASGKSKRRR